MSPSPPSIAAEALPARSLVYIKADNSCALANATTEGKEAVGFVQTAVLAGSSATIKLSGTTITGLTGLVPGAPYYLSSTAGGIATLAAAGNYAPGNVVMQIGTALSPTDLLFRPTLPITL